MQLFFDWLIDWSSIVRSLTVSLNFGYPVKKKIKNTNLTLNVKSNFAPYLLVKRCFYASDRLHFPCGTLELWYPRTRGINIYLEEESPPLPPNLWSSNLCMFFRSQLLNPYANLPQILIVTTEVFLALFKDSKLSKSTFTG